MKYSVRPVLMNKKLIDIHLRPVKEQTIMEGVFTADSPYGLPQELADEIKPVSPSLIDNMMQMPQPQMPQYTPQMPCAAPYWQNMDQNRPPFMAQMPAPNCSAQPGAYPQPGYCSPQMPQQMLQSLMSQFAPQMQQQMPQYAQQMPQPQMPQYAPQMPGAYPEPNFIRNMIDWFFHLFPNNPTYRG